MISAYKTVAFMVLPVVLSLSCSDANQATEKEGPIDSESSAIVGTGHTWTHGDWTSRVLWEARHALSQSANGYSSFTNGLSGKDQRWYGDWDYVASDSTAYTKASSEAGGVVGTISPTLYYAPPNANVYRGGWCTFFVRLALLRSTYWAFSDHYSTPSYPSSMYTITSPPMTQNYASVQPGWALLTSANQHYAIAEKRETIGGVTGWWLIDSNYVCSFCIGKHFMSDSDLASGAYYAWFPDRGTDN